MLFILTIVLALWSPGVHSWKAGVGIADTTGPATEIGMMGYAHIEQTTAGIHTRLYARAFVFEDDSGKRGVFVSVDMGMMGHMLKHFIIENLQNEYGNIYDWDNVIISGTHTHSGPGGYQQYVLYSVTNKGFVDRAFEGLLIGITEAIKRAHDNVQPARLTYIEGELHDANINRSPTSYLVNPEAERAEYEYDTDHNVYQVSIFAKDSNEPLGIINWFAVHPVSVNRTNHMISSDHKGRAGERFEKWMNPNDLMGQGSFVAAFASANLGDVSPNTAGPLCQETGEPCDDLTSTCGGVAQKCWALGPGKDMYDSCRIIGDRQFNKAKELFEDTANQIEIPDGITTAFQWVDMTNVEVELEDGSTAYTCKPSLGYSFAAGCIDGTGAFDFTQGLTEPNNDFWENIVEFLKPPSDEMVACQAPKPILLATGEANLPHAWHPSIVDTQMMKLGNIFLVAFPGELTTMSGRRLRKSIKQAALDAGQPEDEIHVVLAGLSSVYTHYVTTFEEYQRQRYEAASTIFGPHSLRAYQAQYGKLASSLVTGAPVPRGDKPEIMYDRMVSMVPDVLPDVAPGTHDFGDCLEQPGASYVRGDSVVTKFVSGNLRNELMLEDSFLFVEKKSDTVEDQWDIAYRDTDFETMMRWNRTERDLNDYSISEVEITWNIPDSQDVGTYRICHRGYYKSPTQGTFFYEGYSNEFQVNAPATQPNSGHTMRIHTLALLGIVLTLWVFN